MVQLKQQIRRATTLRSDQAFGVARIGRRREVRLAGGASVVAVALAVVVETAGDIHGGPTAQLIAVFGTLAFVVMGVVAVRGATGVLVAACLARGGASAGNAVRLIASAAGYLVVLVVALGLLQVPTGKLLLGGAITGVIVGIAAQQSLGNVFAGFVLLFARPFRVGSHIRVRSGALGGEFSGIVLAMSLTYVTMTTTDGPIKVPNSGMLAAAVGPWRPGTGVTPPSPSERSQSMAHQG